MCRREMKPILPPAGPNESFHLLSSPEGLWTFLVALRGKGKEIGWHIICWCWYIANHNSLVVTGVGI